MDHITLTIAVARGVFLGALLLTVLVWGLRNWDRGAGKAALFVAVLAVASLLFLDPPQAPDVIDWKEYFK